MSYTPTEWDSGDIITAEKLNKIEQGISEASSSGGGEGGGSGDGGLYLLTETEEGIEQSYNDVKAAFDAGKRIELHRTFPEAGMTGLLIYSLSVIAEPVPTRDVTAKPYAVQLCTLYSNIDSNILIFANRDPNEPLTKYDR